MTEKTRETRLRRMADRLGLKLVKSRGRDPRARDFGRYMLVAGTATTGDPEFTLEDVEAWLTAQARPVALVGAVPRRENRHPAETGVPYCPPG